LKPFQPKAGGAFCVSWLEGRAAGAGARSARSEQRTLEDSGGALRRNAQKKKKGNPFCT
jgi:hypothetical protein